MTDNGNRYCDICWSLVLDRGYVDKTDLCAECREWLDELDQELVRRLPVDVVHVERRIV